MTSEPEWLLEPVVIAIHRLLLAEHGGADAIRDRGLLSSTLARPKNRFGYGAPPPSIFDLAASYAYGLVKNHCFVDGNKRIALTAALTFLELNGFHLEAPKTETYLTMIRLASGELAEDDFSRWLATFSKPSGQQPGRASPP